MAEKTNAKKTKRKPRRRPLVNPANHPSGRMIKKKSAGHTNPNIAAANSPATPRKRPVAATAKPKGIQTRSLGLFKVEKGPFTRPPARAVSKKKVKPRKK